LGGLPFKVGAKTGTAEIGAKKHVNSWVMVYWPYEDPRYAMTMVLEKGSVTNLVGGVYAAYNLLSWMSIHTPEYLTNGAD